MYKNQNNSSFRLRTFSAIAISASTMLFASTGCMTPSRVAEASLADCGKAYTKGRERIQDAFDEALDCCRDMLPGNPDGYSSCVRRVEESRRNAQDSLSEAHQACVDANTDLLTTQIEVLFDVVDRAIKVACEVVDVVNIVRSDDSEQLANLTNPMIEYDAMAIDLSGTVIGFDMQPITPQSLDAHARSNSLITARMRGTVKGMNLQGIHSASAEVQMRANLPRDRRSGGTIHSLTLALQGMPVMEIAEGHPSTVKTLDNGSHLICAVLKPRVPFSDSAEPVFGYYVEIPMAISGNRVQAGTSGAFLETESIMPVAPNAIADWNGDFMVDLNDYESFLQDFAIGLIDLNADGATDELDLDIFEDRFNRELGG